MATKPLKPTAATVPPATPATDEPQTLFMPPAEGGSYVRNADGSLTRVEHPTQVPAFEPGKE